jgi:hypothetical protein
VLVVFGPAHWVFFDVGADPIESFPGSDDVIIVIALPYGPSCEPAHFRLESTDHGPQGGAWFVKQKDPVQVVGHDHEGVERQVMMMSWQIAPRGLCDAAFPGETHRALDDFAEHAGSVARARA